MGRARKMTITAKIEGSDNPATRGSHWATMNGRWSLLRDVLGGTERMRECRETHLPKFSHETEENYEIRLNRTVLTNVLEDSVQNAKSRPFSKDVVFKNDTTNYYDKMINADVDMAGTNLHDYAGNTFQEGVETGVVHTLVDMPKTIPDITLAAEQAMNLRPYFVNIKAEDIIAADHTRINGETICTHLRFIESGVERKGFAEKSFYRIKVLEPNRWVSYRSNSRDSGYSIEDHGDLSMDRVPLVTTFFGRKQGGLCVKPPFLDLAYKNVEHWQSSSDQRHILTKGRFAMLAGSGVGTPPEDSNGELLVKAGPELVLLTEDAGGRWYFVEPQGAALEAGRQDLSTLIEEMRIMGLAPLMPKDSGALTATEKAMDEAQAHSQLHEWTRRHEDHLVNCYDMIERWVDMESTGSKIDINSDFGISNRSSEEVRTLLQMRATGDLSRETLYLELQRRNLLNSNFSHDDELVRIDTEEPNFEDA